MALLNDILDHSKVEAGKLDLTLGSCNPQQILEEVVALFAESVQAKGLRIEARWLGPAGQQYRGDPIRLRQMLSNLVSNAIKFTAHGSVRVEAREVDRAGWAATLEFSVTDSGIGIPPEKQSMLFKPFSQVDGSSTREYGGSGLGLSIVRSLALLMGGEVGVDSQAGQGSRFWFRARLEVLPDSTAERTVDAAITGVVSSMAAAATPRASTSANAAAAPTQATAAGRSILVVDDSTINRKVIESLLGKLGFAASGVDNGQQAVDAITQGLRPGLVLMDVQMPVLDGYQATVNIRRWERENNLPHLPIVALTASAYEEDRQHCIDAGMDDFLTKPVDIHKLTAMLAKWFGDAGPAATGGA